MVKFASTGGAVEHGMHIQSFMHQHAHMHKRSQFLRGRGGPGRPGPGCLGLGVRGSFTFLPWWR